MKQFDLIEGTECNNLTKHTMSQTNMNVKQRSAMSWRYSDEISFPNLISMMLKPPSLPIDEVRQVIKQIIDESLAGRQLFTVRDHLTSGIMQPYLYLRSHLPVRVSPQGAPLVLLSVVDHFQQNQLIDQGVLDAKQYYAEIKHIFYRDQFEAVPDTHVETYSAEGTF
jgi:hypothetical protein